MKTSLLLFFMGTLIMTSQVTHDLDWFLGAGTNLDLTIDNGDTVRWTWTDALSHTVTSTSGVDHPFDSGLITGNGQTFSYTFNIVGATSYICTPHSLSMGGTITVLATASIEDHQTVVFNFSPNPVQDNISINAAINISKIEIYSILGQKLYEQNPNLREVKIDISTFTQSIYFAKLRFEDNSYGVFRIIKK